VRVSRGVALLVAAARALQWAALACWTYVALTGIITPQYLPLRFDGTLPIRTDTSGEVAFAASTCLLMLTAVFGSGLVSTRASARVIWSVARSLALHAAAGWAYISANSISHRSTLQLPLTHFASWPTEGDFAIGCLVVAVCSLCVYVGLKPSVNGNA
jgi:hypothetical protein